MKRVLLPGLAVVAALVVGALVWLSRDSADGAAVPVDGARNGTSSTAPGLDAGSDLDAALSPAEKAARDARALAAAPNSSANGPALSGEVVPPPDCAADDTVEVFALAREADLDALFGALSEAIGPRRADANPSSLVLARVPLDAQHRFHLPLPAGARKAHVIFAGRSWFLRDSLAVDVKSGAAQVMLQAECGGWIAGRLDLPSSALGRASELDGDVAVVRPAVAGGFGAGPRGGFRRSERRALVEGLAFEVRALDPGAPYTLEIVPKILAAVQVEVPDVARGTATNVVVPLTPGGSLTGRAVGAGGEPVAGAHIEARLKGQLFGFDDRTVRTTESRDDGTFQLAAVAAGALQVGATSKDRLPSKSLDLDVAEGAALTGVELVLGVGETIAGVVTWKDGRPAAGASIDVVAERGGRNFGPQTARPMGLRADEPRAVADEQGRFVVQGLASGTYAVTAEALTPEGAAIAGTSKPERSQADAKRKLAWRARASGVKTGATDVALALEAPLVVRGTVKSKESGAPVTQFTVEAQPSGRNGGPGAGGPPGGMQGFPGAAATGRNAEEFSDERGEFVLGGLREGTWRIVASADGCAPMEGIEVTLPRKEDEPPLAFVLERGAGIQGVVMSPGGGPVAGATVARAATGAAWMRGPGADDGLHARTDARGKFHLDGLAAGRIELVAQARDWAQSDTLALDLVAGITLADVVLNVHQGGRISGEIYEEGRPAGGRTLNATHLGNFTNVSARSDERGRFALEHLSAGSWRVIAIPSGDTQGGPGDGGRGGGRGMFGNMQSTSVDVADGQESHVVIGAPPVDPVQVRGHVLQGGAGVAGARVVFMQQGKTPGEGTKTARTADDGGYALQLDAPGAYAVLVTLAASRLSPIEFEETVPPGGDVVVDLPLPTARISGRVRTPDGDPAARVRVTLLAGEQTVGGSIAGGFNDIQTDEQGAFDWTALRAGDYSLSVGGASPMGRGPAAASPWGKKIVPGIRVAEGEWKKDVDVRLEKAGSVSVEVVDDHGGKVPGATVFARDAGGRAVERLSGVRSDGEGKATYSGLAPGAYTFSAHKDGTASGESSRVDVSEGGSGSVRVTLAAGTILYVTTVDAQGAPARAQVSVRDEGGRDVAGLLGYQELGERFNRNAGGNEQKIGALPPGKYRVRATTSDGRSAERSVTLSGEAESRLTLTLQGA